MRSQNENEPKFVLLVDSLHCMMKLLLKAFTKCHFFHFPKADNAADNVKDILCRWGAFKGLDKVGKAKVVVLVRLPVGRVDVGKVNHLHHHR